MHFGTEIKFILESQNMSKKAMTVYLLASEYEVVRFENCWQFNI